jgi:exopolyphosphatase / guanosine-5'-triphosphate,3'-diphosphate pyrophosphatase
VTRAAAIDIGTNSTRLLVADVEEGRLEELVRTTTITRLGEGVDAGRRLLPAAIERTLAVLEEYAGAIEALGAERTLVVATSAARDAANGREFLDGIARRFGFATRLLSGDEEAGLTRRGVGAAGEGTLVVDVGGGSTELILGERRASIDVGSVRLTERFLHGDPPAAGELEQASAYARSLLPELQVERAIGVAGTVAQLHLLAGELTAEAVERELAHLAALTAAQRAALPAMVPGRAPVIVGGTLVVREVLRAYGLPGIAFSVRDLLDGALLAALE